jgi:hypothetical protein
MNVSAYIAANGRTSGARDAFAYPSKNACSSLCLLSPMSFMTASLDASLPTLPTPPGELPTKAIAR